MSERTETLRRPTRAEARQASKNRLVAGGLDALQTREIALIFAILSIVYMAPALIPGQQIAGSDYLGGGVFILRFIADALKSGQLPGWLPDIYAGLPLFANPGSTWYLPWTVSAVAISPEKAFTLVFVLQYTIAGLGTYLLCRELDVRKPIALVAGLCYQFTGLTLSYIHAGHDGRVICATMAPLVFYFLHRGIRTGEVLQFMGAAVAIGLAFLSFQIQSAYYLLLGSMIWSIYALFRLDVVRDKGRLARMLVLGLGAVAAAFALAAVDFLPFLGYIDWSPRGGGGRGYDFAVTWSMPPEEITGLAVPEHMGTLGTYRGTNPFKLHTEYVGALVILLLPLGAFLAWRDRRWLFFLGLTLFSLSIAFGGHTPIYRLYYAVLPGTRMFRAPSIVMFLVSMSLTMMAALTLERLATLRDGFERPQPDDGSRALTHDARRVLMGSAIAVFVLAILVWIVSAGPGRITMIRGFMRLAFFTALFAVPLWFWLKGNLKTWTLAIILSGVVVVDLWSVGKQFFATVGPTEEIFAADDVTQFLKKEAGDFRVWPIPWPPKGAYRPQSGYLMNHGIQQIGGLHGNQPEHINRFLGRGDSVMVDWHNLENRPAMVAAANIRYIVTGAPMNSPALRRVFTGGRVAINPEEYVEYSVFSFDSALPRAWVVPQVLTAPTQDSALALTENVEFDPRFQAVTVGTGLADLSLRKELTADARITMREANRVEITVNASAPGFLVLADSYYPDWHVTVNDEPATMYRTNYAFRGVKVPAGRSSVVFSFRPKALYAGAAISGLTALALGTAIARALRKRREQATEEIV